MTNSVVIDVVNLALAHCSYGPITTLDDQRKEARDMAQYLPIAMDMALAREDWSFNQLSMYADFDNTQNPVLYGLNKTYAAYTVTAINFLTITKVLEEENGSTLPDHEVIRHVLWIPLQGESYAQVVACGRGRILYMDPAFNIEYDRDKFIDYAADILASIAIGGIAGNAGVGPQIEDRASKKLAIVNNGRHSYSRSFSIKRVDTR